MICVEVLRVGSLLQPGPERQLKIMKIEDQNEKIFLCRKIQGSKIKTKTKKGSFRAV